MPQLRKREIIKRTAQLVGHAPGSPITQSVYTHASPEVLLEAVATLDEAFAPLVKIAHEPAAKPAPRARPNCPYGS
jgi:hypothetical protein